MALQFTRAASEGWLALAHSGRVIAVAASVDEEFISAAWKAIEHDDGFQELLDLLTSKGLAATPPFVLVEWQQGSNARVIVRGDSIVEVTDAAGTHQLAAAGVSTWVESSLPSVTGIALAVAGAIPGTGPALPLESGAAVIAALSIGTAAPVAAPVAAPQKASSAFRAPAPPPTPSVADKLAAPAPAAPVVTPPPAPAPVPPTPEPVDVEATMIVSITDPGTPDEPEVASPGDEPSYDYLFGDTMHRSVADAAVREADDEGGDTAGAELDESTGGDHDGETVLTSDIAKLRGKRRPRAAASAPAAEVPAKLVLVLSTTGARESLDTPVLVGRAPSVSKVSGGQLPRLVTIGSIDQDISRNHAQFALEGGTVVVTDLHSKNGTSIVLPGKSAQKLRPGEPTSVIVGTVVDLGGGLAFTVEEDA